MRAYRTQQIVDRLQDKRFCSVSELVRHFNVSPATIHRDIAELVHNGLANKVRGGVASIPPTASTSAPVTLSHFSSRVSNQIEKKKHIAELAVSHVKEGDILFLDSSTTVLHLARKLQKLQLSNLTIITNSVAIIQEFHLYPQCFSLFTLGGSYNYQLHSLLGKTTISHLKNLKIDRAFISAFGLTSESVTTYHEDHADFLSTVLQLSNQSILLLDSTKFQREGLFTICKTSEVDLLISDAKPPLCKGQSKAVLMH